MESEKRIITDAGQQGIAVLALFDPRTELLKRKSLGDEQARRDILDGSFRGSDVTTNRTPSAGATAISVSGIFERREARHDRSCWVAPVSPRNEVG